jgi:hypothetical protein
MVLIVVLTYCSAWSQSTPFFSTPLIVKYFLGFFLVAILELYQATLFIKACIDVSRT